MTKAKIRTVVAIAIFSSIAAATPARAASTSSICDIDPEVSFYSWFAHTFGYCR
jgi:hypothetical protein